MPHYDYECDACGKTTEIFQGIKDRPKKKCPDCGKLKLRRVISGGCGLIFKGTGFYITDYGRGNGNGKKPEIKPEEVKANMKAKPTEKKAKT